MIPDTARDIIYVIAAVLFIFDLKWMSHPRTAVRGNKLGSLGMVLAIAATLITGLWIWRLLLIRDLHEAYHRGADPR